MKKITIVSMLAIAAYSAGAQNIITYAGNGTFGYSGDGGAATAASFGINYGIALDASNNLYIADQQNNEIRKVNALTWKISTIAGNSRVAGATGDGGNATAAELNNPTGVAIDASGNIYIADAGNNKVRKINTSGIISTVAGTGTAGYTGDGAAATNATLHSPSGVAVDAFGDIYIADQANNVVRVVNGGNISTLAGNGTAGATGDGGLATAAELDMPFSVTVDATTNKLYIADEYNNKIRVVNTSGTISTFAGNGTAAFAGDGSAATAASLYYPMSVALDSKGNVYIADQYNSAVRMVNTSGNISTYAGMGGSPGFSGDGGPATAAKMSLPAGLAINTNGNLFISEQGGLRVRETLDPTGINQASNTGDIKIYPNPASDKLNIELSGTTGKVNLTLYNIAGQSVMSQVSDRQNIGLDVATLPAGIYILKVVGSDGSTLVRKVEISK